MATRKNTAETDARHTKILTDLQTQECNRVCADCNTKGPRWASVNLGVFLCIRCSGLHRQIGVAITKVRSTTLDTWTPEQIQMMVKTGNGVANLYYEANLPPNEKPNEHTDARTMENFIRNKYERFKWALERVPISEASSKTIRFISGGGASGGSSSKSSRRKRGEESERKPKSSRRHRMRDQDEYSPEEGASEDDEEERRRAERRAARRARRAQREAAQSSPAPAPSSTASSSRKVSSSSRRAAAVGDFEDDFEESPSQPHRRSKRSSRRSGLEEEAAAPAAGGASEDEDPFGFKSSAAKKAVAANSVEDLFAPSDFERKKWSILDGSAGAGADPTAHEAPRPANDIPQGMQAPGGGLFAPSGYAGMQPMQMGMSMMSIGQQQQQQGAGMFPMMQQHQGFAGMAQPYGYGMPMQQQGSGFAGMQMQPQQQGFGGMGFGYR